MLTPTLDKVKCPTNVGHYPEMKVTPKLMDKPKPSNLLAMLFGGAALLGASLLVNTEDKPSTRYDPNKEPYGFENYYPDDKDYDPLEWKHKHQHYEAWYRTINPEEKWNDKDLRLFKNEFQEDWSRHTLTKPNWTWGEFYDFCEKWVNTPNQESIEEKIDKELTRLGDSDAFGTIQNQLSFFRKAKETYSKDKDAQNRLLKDGWTIEEIQSLQFHINSAIEKLNAKSIHEIGKIEPTKNPEYTTYDGTSVHINIDGKTCGSIVSFELKDSPSGQGELKLTRILDTKSIEEIRKELDGKEIEIIGANEYGHRLQVYKGQVQVQQITTSISVDDMIFEAHILCNVWRNSISEPVHQVAQFIPPTNKYTEVPPELFSARDDNMKYDPNDQKHLDHVNDYIMFRFKHIYPKGAWTQENIQKYTREIYKIAMGMVRPLVWNEVYKMVNTCVEKYRAKEEKKVDAIKAFIEQYCAAVSNEGCPDPLKDLRTQAANQDKWNTLDWTKKDLEVLLREIETKIVWEEINKVSKKISMVDQYDSILSTPIISPVPIYIPSHIVLDTKDLQIPMPFHYYNYADTGNH